MNDVLVLHDMILPPPGMDAASYGLYMRQVAELGEENGVRVLRLRGQAGREGVAFDTWFNAFSLAKWRKYTHLREVVLRLCLRGTCRVDLCAVDEANRERLLSRHDIEAADTPEAEGMLGFREVFLPFPQADDAVLLFWRIAGEDCTLREAAYVANIPEQKRNDVRLSIVICTFRREEYVSKTLNAIARSVEGGACPPEDIRVRVVDNGQSLTPEVCVRPYMTIYPNRNAGGSGGFARGMLETQSDTDFAATHILLMDDDIELPDGVLQKTLALLRLLRSEYAHSYIGGAMFVLHQKNRVHASIESMQGKFFIHKVLGDMDMLQRNNIVAVETYPECPGQYQAWWYCVMPVTVLSRHGFPYPFFFQLDDIEYHLRSECKHIIIMSGINVWHEAFFLKEDNAKLFYNFKNHLLFAELHPRYRLALTLSLMRLIAYNIFIFNYKALHALNMALESFLEGPEQMNRPGIYDEWLKLARQCNDACVPIEQCAPVRSANIPLLGPMRKAVMILTLNGHLLPCFVRRACTHYSRQNRYSMLASAYLRKGLSLESGAGPLTTASRAHDAEKIMRPDAGHGPPDVGIVRTCSTTRLVKECMRLLPTLWRYCLHRNRLGIRYRETALQMTAAPWWREHLSQETTEH